MTLPHPENPQHVENLNSIELLKLQGFKGIDADLAESLFVYGMVWRELPESNELLVVYGIKWDDDKQQNVTFDRCVFNLDMDFPKEFNWVNCEELASFNGLQFEEWNEMDLTQKIQGLFDAYGYENVFGTSYWGGFEVKE